MGGSQALLAAQPLTVSGATMSGILVGARPLGTMRGRVTRDIDARHPLPSLPPAGGLRLDPANGFTDFGMPRSSARPDDATEEFTIEGIGRGQFHLRASYGWLIKSVTWNGRDHVNLPFDTSSVTTLDNVAVVVTNAGASVSGVVRSQTGPATVVLFPSAEERWTDFGLLPVDVRRASTAAGGRFTIEALPAGDYYLVAIAPDRLLELTPDNFRKWLQAATPVTLGWGESRSIDLRVAGEVP